MAYVPVTGLWYPELPLNALLTGTIVTDLLLDASGEKVAFIFPAPATGQLDLIGFLTGTVTVGDTMKVSFQGVDDATGEPDGGIDQFRTIAIANGDDVVWKTTGLITSDGTDGGTKRSVTKGELIAIVIEFNSFTATDSLNIRCWRQPGATSNHLGQCYVSHFTTVWTKTNGILPTFALKYADGNYYYIPGTAPYSAVTSISIDNATSPDEAGAYFSVPFACKIDRIFAWVDADGDVDVVLYDGDGSTPLKTLTLDKDIRVTNVSIGYAKPFDEVTLTPGVNYRLVFKPSSLTNIAFFVMEVAAAEILGQMSGGTGIHYTSREDAGAWAQVTTQRAPLYIGVSALSDVVTGGGRPELRGSNL